MMNPREPTLSLSFLEFPTSPSFSPFYTRELNEREGRCPV